MSWDELEGRLASALAKMAVESFLILSLPSDEVGQRAYVQFAHWGEADGSSAGLRAEAVGNTHLPATRHLTPAQTERLAGLGWRSPGPDEASGNFVAEWTMPAPFAEVAALVSRTLREVYGVDSPAQLRFRYSSFTDTEVVHLDLGLEPEERRPRPKSKPPIRPAAAPLGPVVEEGLRRWLGVDRLERDADGDYPVPVGSALLFVRLLEGRPPMIGIFSAILAGVEPEPMLLAALNEINRRIRFARVFWVGGTVVIAGELAAVDITADQIAFACVQLGALADHLDDVLKGRFGGTLAFEVPPGIIH
jgi:hypothetical protein